jgi:hypothetical protein
MVRFELETRNLAPKDTVSLRFRDKVGIELSGMLGRWGSSVDFLRWRPDSRKDLQTFQKRFRKFQARMSRCATGSGVCLVDEGIFQLMWLLHQKTAQKDMHLIAKALGRYVAFPDIVVLVGASEGGIEARRTKRGNAGDLARPRTTPSGREARRQLADLLARLIDEGAPLTVHMVHNDDLDQLSQAAAEVAGQTARMFSKSTWSAHPSRRLMDLPGCRPET